MDMLILLVTVFCALWGPSATLDEEEVCYGQDLTFPWHILPNIQEGLLYFTPSNGGKRKILMENGKAKDPRLKVGRFTSSLKDLTKEDEGVFAYTFSSKTADVLRLKIKDCAEKITKDYMQEWIYRAPMATHYVEYTSPHNENETLILWNLTSPLSKQRRGDIKNNFWRISGVTQADNGFYNFRRKEGTLRSRVLLTVKENTHYYDPGVKKDLVITMPGTQRPWTVTFKEDIDTKQVTIIENGNLVRDVNRFSGRISIYIDDIQIRSVDAMDSGIYEFRDSQGNLALSAHVQVNEQVSHHLVTYVVVAVVVAVLGMCCCLCCKRKCCCKNKSAATDGSAVTYHDKSDSAAPPPTVYYHGTNQPTGPSYPIQTSAGYTPHPANPPAYTQTVVSIEQPPSQPSTTVYPPQPASVYPLQPASVNPPQPEPSLYPPLSEFGPPASQGPAAAPTFSSGMFSPDAEPRFQLKGLAFPSAPPLSSDAPTCDVYNSDKLNFL